MRGTIFYDIGFIYNIKHNNEIVYIGSTNDLEMRLRNHNL